MRESSESVNKQMTDSGRLCSCVNVKVDISVYAAHLATTTVALSAAQTQQNIAE